MTNKTPVPERKITRQVYHPNGKKKNQLVHHNAGYDCGVPNCTEKKPLLQTEENKNKKTWESEFNRKFCCDTTPHIPCFHLFSDSEAMITQEVKKFIAQVEKEAREEAGNETIEYYELKMKKKWIHEAYLRGLTKGYNEVLQRIEDGESIEKIREEL